ncbi:hypothetical protein [Amycolatopsis panacis]|uniref:Uncharacterized protein n=1 Tax=Amycolatopsis panacis TaxID=2340917 RepID=A0A419I4R5_9PSEU|nr:hypothetical protein [Amycolatopsis panacis]RJQ85494.1 hypothetical protein D5S19_14025 [Amycolatopsis panacis]
MSDTRPPSSPSTASTITAALDKATRAVYQAVRERGESDRPPLPGAVRAGTWQLIHLLGALGELAATLAPHVGSYPQRYRLHTDDDTNPAQHVAHACRELAALRHALEKGQRAAREIHTALSHLNTLPPPDHRESGSAGNTERDEGR